MILDRADQFERFDYIWLNYADRLRHTLRSSAETAAAAGMTEEKLRGLLADES